MRSGNVKKRKIEADLVYDSTLVAKFINKTMQSGKKSLAQKLVYQALDIIKKKNEDPIKILESAVFNVSPRSEVRPRRIGGASYQIPMEVRGDRRISLALRWIIAAARARPSSQFHHFSEKLAVEILEAAASQGEAIKKRDQMHRMAEANKAFAHFRW
jgi:small subunit ribosomal protein S7